jgi:hypothetical protein
MDISWRSAHPLNLSPIANVAIEQTSIFQLFLPSKLCASKCFLFCLFPLLLLLFIVFGIIAYYPSLICIAAALLCVIIVELLQFFMNIKLSIISCILSILTLNLIANLVVQLFMRSFKYFITDFSLSSLVVIIMDLLFHYSLINLTNQNQQPLHPMNPKKELFEMKKSEEFPKPENEQKIENQSTGFKPQQGFHSFQDEFSFRKDFEDNSQSFQIEEEKVPHTETPFQLTKENDYDPNFYIK